MLLTKAEMLGKLHTKYLACEGQNLCTTLCLVRGCTLFVTCFAVFLKFQSAFCEDAGMVLREKQYLMTAAINLFQMKSAVSVCTLPFLKISFVHEA